MFEYELARLLGISKPRKRKTPLEETSEIFANVATAAGTLAVLFHVGSWLLEKK